MSDKTSIGDRMKAYENVTRTYLMSRGYVIYRIDGRSFHSYVKRCNCTRPFDDGLIEDMDNTAIHLCENIQNAKLAFVQSDEISILTSNFDTITTQTFFDGNIQKIVSVAASMATAKFNALRFARSCLVDKTPRWNFDNVPLAEFDCRVWNVPSQIEAYNTLLWRQQDASRNSLSSVAQSIYSHKELHGKNGIQMHEMLREAGINWATKYTDGQKNGRLIVKETYTIPTSVADTVNFKVVPSEAQRTRWVSKGAWKFTENKEALLAMIPKYE